MGGECVVSWGRRSAMDSGRRLGAWISGKAAGFRVSLCRSQWHVVFLGLLLCQAASLCVPRTQQHVRENQRASMCVGRSAIKHQPRSVSLRPRWSSGGSPRQGTVNQTLLSFLPENERFVESLFPSSLGRIVATFPSLCSPGLFLGAYAEFVHSAKTHDATTPAAGGVPGRADRAGAKTHRTKKKSHLHHNARRSKKGQDVHGSEKGAQSESEARVLEAEREPENARGEGAASSSLQAPTIHLHADTAPFAEGAPQHGTKNGRIVIALHAPSSSAAYPWKPADEDGPGSEFSQVFRSLPLVPGQELPLANRTLEANLHGSLALELRPQADRSLGHPFRGLKSNPHGTREALEGRGVQSTEPVDATEENAGSGLKGEVLVEEKQAVFPSGRKEFATEPQREGRLSEQSQDVTESMQPFALPSQGVQLPRKLESARSPAAGDGVRPTSRDIRAGVRRPPANPRWRGHQKQGDKGQSAGGGVQPPGESSNPSGKAALDSPLPISAASQGTSPRGRPGESGNTSREADPFSVASHANHGGEGRETSATDQTFHPSSPSTSQNTAEFGSASSYVPSPSDSPSDATRYHPEALQSIPPLERTGHGPGIAGRRRRWPREWDGDGNPGSRRTFRGWQNAFPRARLGGAFAFPEDPVANDWAPHDDPKRLGGAPLFDFSEEDLKRMGFETPIEQTPSPSQEMDANYKSIPASMFIFPPGARRGDLEAAVQRQGDGGRRMVRSAEVQSIRGVSADELANGHKPSTETVAKALKVTTEAGPAVDSSYQRYNNISNSESSDQDPLLFDDIMEAPTPTPSLFGHFSPLDGNSSVDSRAEKGE
ncbi:conserved hypothetical protein [Neospora caninum Liverpool]|uniref:Uncharacterized protein n=1 Tax=Neospora caninum (strain Liverpool) TaxID=572307 RepID=F0VFK2_NEOCL|nr:conserved hypothetical protein [Neospora caninum Liverpool]CBZ52496.1 conserved hypothetical protein [Neospora caninum Liverpool]|eukprot:XP_003882528.1 conserved hypothetical protein [Neospora caninum Liverpool]